MNKVVFYLLLWLSLLGLSLVLHAQDESEPSGLPVLCISGVVTNSFGSFVVINDKLFKEGDTVDGFEIKSIEGLNVSFQQKGISFTKSVNLNCALEDKNNKEVKYESINRGADKSNSQHNLQNNPYSNPDDPMMNDPGLYPEQFMNQPL